MKILNLPTLVVPPCMALAKPVPATDVSFQKIQILDQFISEGTSMGDIDADGQPDIVISNKKGVFAFIQQ